MRQPATRHRRRPVTLIAALALGPVVTAGLSGCTLLAAAAVGGGAGYVAGHEAAEHEMEREGHTHDDADTEHDGDT